MSGLNSIYEKAFEKHEKGAVGEAFAPFVAAAGEWHSLRHLWYL